MAYLGEIHSSLPARVNAREGVVCRGPPKIGPLECKAAFKRYYYDEESETCKLFIYGGCGATKNNFNSMEECQKTCPPGRDVCQMPKKTGRCKITPGTPWQRTRYFFNVDSQECEKFIFGGCGGNANNFPSKQICKERCEPNVCELPQKTGPCRASYTQYFFNIDSQECEKFIYGGCGGNANNFPSKQACKERCKPVNVCELPPETGPCRASYTNFFFDVDTQRCETFTYGGCDGNANNFHSLLDCLETCEWPSGR